MARIYFSGGDVMLEGFGRLDAGAQEHLLDVTKDEFLAAIKARDTLAFRAAKARGLALLDARQAADQWNRASRPVSR